MNKNFNQTAGEVAQKSYLSYVVRATDIAIEAYNNSHKFDLSTGQVTKNVASPAQNGPVIGLEDRLLLTRCLCFRLDLLNVITGVHSFRPIFQIKLHNFPKTLQVRIVHRDPIKMHPFCLGLYFRNQSIKMKNYFIISSSRVLSFIGEILSKIRRRVLEKSRIL